MEKFKFTNGVKLIYEKSEKNITSFCIGFEAGAFAENDDEIGMAHALEHVLFKGTKNYSEYQINKMCDKIFGFCNAMTNYPYVIYYGTCLTKDFTRGFNLYSDIVLNPSFTDDGFAEEMNVIKEELSEWKEEPYQLCEDELFKNSYCKSRLNKIIIGDDASLCNITIEKLKNFYIKNYTPDNCVISVVTSLEFEDIKKIVGRLYSNWETENYKRSEVNYYENNKAGVYTCYSNGTGGAKIQYIFHINDLNDEEINTLKVFNSAFGEGTSSILYDFIRTKNGLAYDVKSYLKNEKGIKLFCIQLGTSVEKIDNVLKIINSIISDTAMLCNCFTEEYINEIVHRIELKNEIRKERSIELSINLCRSEIMYDNAQKVFENIPFKQISKNKIQTLVEKILINPSIQILISKTL